MGGLSVLEIEVGDKKHQGKWKVNGMKSVNGKIEVQFPFNIRPSV